MFLVLLVMIALCSAAIASPLSELWNHGETAGTLSPISIADIDNDGVDDILCLKYAQEATAPGYITSFKLVKGDTFATLYNWITPPGDISNVFGPFDIDGNGSDEVYAISSVEVADDQYETKIIVYNALNGTQIWESMPFSYTTALPPVYPIFSAYPADLIGTAENDWLINYSVTNPSNGAETGRVMVYRKDAGDVGFTQLQWEMSYAGGTVNTFDTHYDLERDGKLNLAVNFSPQEGSGQKGASIFYKPSGMSSFSELTRFESSQPGNNLSLVYTDSSLRDMYPTKVDRGVNGGNLLFIESWQDAGEYRNVLQAFRADTPYTRIGTYTYDGASLSVSPNDCNGDGWDELVIKYYDFDAQTSSVSVYAVQGGTFSLSELWETGEVSGNQLVQSHWDLNGDDKVDIGIQWLPLDSDTTSYGNLTFYQMTGSSFSQLHRFTAAYPGHVYVDPVEADRQRVAGPTEYLYVPVDLDCVAGGNIAITSTYDRFTVMPLPQYEQNGKITIYNIPSATVAWESPSFNSYISGVHVSHLRSFPSKDLLINVYTMEFSMSGFAYAGDAYVYSCGQSTDPVTTTTTATQSSTTTTAGEDPCPSEEIYGAYSEEAALLRQFRDEVLSRTPEGREMIKLYYEASPAVVGMLRADNGLKDEMKTFIDSILPLIAHTR
jgi:hypothetical protein